MFDTPGSSSSSIAWNDLLGRLLVFEVHSHETNVPTVFGPKDPVCATITIVDGPNAGTVHNEAFVFPGKLVSQLKGKIGRKVLGRLGQGTAQPGQSPPWVLLEATTEDQALATAFSAFNTAPTSSAPVAPTSPL